MLAVALLLAASSPAGGASAVAVASARVVRGERIDLAAPGARPDRQLRVTRHVSRQDGPMIVRVVEFE